MAVRREFPDVDDETQTDMYENLSYAQYRERHAPLDYPTGALNYYCEGEAVHLPAFYWTNRDVDSDYYQQVFEFLPDDPRRFTLRRYVNAVRGYHARAEAQATKPFDADFREVLEIQNLELTAYDVAVPNPRDVVVADSLVSFDSIRNADIMRGCYLRKWNDLERGGNFELSCGYKETARDGQTRHSIVRFPFWATRAEKPFTYGFLWGKITAYFQENPHSGWRANLLRPHTQKNHQAMFCSIISGFVKSMLFDGIPAEKVLDWFLQQEYLSGAGLAHSKKDIDSHVLKLPVICVLFYFHRGLQQTREEALLNGVRRALERTRPFLATGAPMREHEDEKKTRFVARFILESTGLMHKFKEEGQYAPAGRVDHRDNGLFLRQKLGTKLTKSDWARLIARAQHFASFYYGHACGSAADQCLYSAYDIKEMMFRDGTRNFLASGYLSFQQYELSLTGCQYAGMDLAKTGFEVVHPRHPMRQLLDYEADDEKLTCRRPQILFGLGEAIYGEMLVEKTFCQTHCFDPERLHMEWAPRYFSREQELELQKQEDEFNLHCPVRLQNELYDVREESAFKYAARRRKGDPFCIRHF